MPVEKLSKKQLENGNFTTIPNSVICNADISLNAFKVYAVAISKPKNWIFRLEEFTQDVFKTKSINRLKNAIEELRSFGLVTGSFVTKDLTFYQCPIKKTLEERKAELEAKLSACR